MNKHTFSSPISGRVASEPSGFSPIVTQKPTHMVTAACGLKDGTMSTTAHDGEPVRNTHRRTRVAATATAVLLLLLTWWASGAADAAQPFSQAASLVSPLPFSPWWPRWSATHPLRESGIIASVGSGLIALAACLRRAGRLK